jgi:hypothetical protein
VWAIVTCGSHGPALVLSTWVVAEAAPLLLFMHFAWQSRIGDAAAEVVYGMHALRQSGVRSVSVWHCCSTAVLNCNRAY